MFQERKISKGKNCKKKGYFITPSEDTVNKFNKKSTRISRSQAIKNLILNDLKNSLAHNSGPTREERKSMRRKEVLQNV